LSAPSSDVNSIVLATAGAIAREQTANTQIYPYYRTLGLAYLSQFAAQAVYQAVYIDPNCEALNDPDLTESDWENAYAYLTAGRNASDLADTAIWADEAGAGRPGADRETVAFVFNAEVFPIFIISTLAEDHGDLIENIENPWGSDFRCKVQL
jgi:hypothetical protein